MKKLMTFVIAFIFILVLIGCTAEKEHTIRIVIPAGSRAEFVYSEAEISPLNSQVTMKSIDVADRTSVVLQAVASEYEDVSTFFTKGEPMIVNAEKGAWYKIGIAMQNPTDQDIIVSINIENANVRID